MGDKQAKKQGLSYTQLKRIWTSVGVSNWLDILRTYKKGHHFSVQSPGVLKGCCLNPDHADTNPSSYIYIDKGYYRCFGCGDYVRNPLVLAQYILGGSQPDALEYLVSKYKIPAINKNVQKELEILHRHQRAKQEIYNTTHQLLCDAIASPEDASYAFARPAIDYLVNYRGIPETALHALPIGVMPPLVELVKDVRLTYARAKFEWDETPELTRGPEPVDLSAYVQEYLSGSVDADFNGSLVFPLHVTPAEIGRLKFRVPSTQSKQFRIPGNEYDDSMGLFGLGWSQYHEHVTQNPDTRLIYVTEGEFDVLQLMADWALRGDAPFVLLGAGGTSSTPYMEGILESIGVTHVNLVGDAPNNMGDTVVSEWLGGLHNIQAKIFVGWNQLAGAMDLDAATTRLGPAAVETILTGPDYAPAWSWCFEHAVPELDLIDPTDVRGIIDSAVRIGHVVRNKIEQECYCDAVVARYSVNPSLLKREMAAREDTPTGFIMKLVDAISDILCIVGNEQYDRRRVLVTYIKSTRELRRLPIDDNKFLETLSTYTGPLYYFIEQRVGYPTFLSHPDEPGVNLQRLDSDLKLYMRQAILHLAYNTPGVSVEQYRQGYHRVPLHDHTHVEYVVCGADIWHIVRNEQGEAIYKLLDGPRHENKIFNVHNRHGNPVQPWYPGGLTTKILDEGKTYDLSNLYDDLVEVYDVGFAFKHHTLTCQLLAAMTLFFPIAGAMRRQLLVHITGQTSSGKTTLAHVLGSPGGDKITEVLHHSIYWNTYTTAGICNSMDGSALVHILDEFEKENPKNGPYVEEIREIIRPIVNGGPHKRIKSGSEGSIEQTFNCSVITVSIQGASQPQDINRQIAIHTQKVDGKDNPETTLLSVLGPAKLKEIGDKVSTIMFPLALKLRELEEEINNSFKALSALLPFSMEYRMASGFFGLMAIMRLAGKDDKKFFLDYMQAHADAITYASTANESDNYLGAILRSPVTIIGGDGKLLKMTAMQLLADNDHRNRLNTAVAGTYYDHKTKCLLLLLDTVLQVLVPTHMKPVGMMATRLKEILGRHSQAISATEVRSSGILSRAIPTLGAGIRERDTVVINVQPWLNEGAAIFTPEPIEKSEEPSNDAGAAKRKSDYIW